MEIIPVCKSLLPLRMFNTWFITVQSSTGAEKGSTGQMSPHSLSSLYHTEAISVNYTAHNASHHGQFLNDTLPIMDVLVKEK